LHLRTTMKDIASYFAHFDTKAMVYVIYPMWYIRHTYP